MRTLEPDSDLPFTPVKYKTTARDENDEIGKKTVVTRKSHDGTVMSTVEWRGTFPLPAVKAQR